MRSVEGVREVVNYVSLLVSLVELGEGKRGEGTFSRMRSSTGVAEEDIVRVDIVDDTVENRGRRREEREDRRYIWRCRRRSNGCII